VAEFQYLGNIIFDTLAHDSYICREIRNMYLELSCLSVGLASVIQYLKYGCLENIAFTFMVLVYGQVILRAIRINSRYCEDVVWP